MEIEKDFQITPNDGTLDPEAMLAALIGAGYSNTRARRAVIGAICEAGGRASPTTLLTLGRQRHPALGMVTVYRTLDLMLELNLIRKLHTEDGCHSYAPSTHDHGHHVICERCRRAVEFEGCDLLGVMATVEAQTGFRVRTHWLELFGLCPECQRQEGTTGAA